VIELAKAVGRTPSAVSWKLANFARLDPALQKRNIVGAARMAQAPRRRSGMSGCGLLTVTPDLKFRLSSKLEKI
jgi:hypothetical protein